MSYSRFIPNAEEAKQLDRETIEGLANLMGISIKEVEAEIKEAEELSRKAWKKSRRRNKQKQAGEITDYRFLMEFKGKRMFYTFYGENSFIVGVDGTTYGTSDLKEAMHILACY